VTAENEFVVAAVGNERFGFPLLNVERVVRSVHVTPLGDSDGDCLGTVSYHGELVPVFDLRPERGTEAKPVGLSEQFVVCKTSEGHRVLVVESVLGVFTLAADRLVAAEAILPDLNYIAHVAKLPDGLITILDPERFFNSKGGRSLR